MTRNVLMARIRLLLTLIVAGPALFVAAPTAAQYVSPLRLHGGLGVSTTSYSPVAAERSNTVDRSFGVQAFLEPRLFDTIGVPISVGWEYLGPVCFDVDSSVDCAARVEERTSLLFGSVGAALHGPPIPLAFDGEASDGRPFVIVGREWVSRGIGDDGCLNCALDTVRFEGGLFIEPGVSFSAGRDLIVSLGYRLYRSGSDLENRLGVRLLTRGR